MTQENPRLWAIREVSRRRVRSVPELSRGVRIAETFGRNTFDDRAMREKLPRDVHDSLQETIRRGTKLDPALANEVAHGMKEWALAKGVTHFCHWFQPQTGLTAEKHDAFLTFDDAGRPVERFSGAQLVQGEPDASSFPSGGVRTTFEARGYTAWDPSSPVFVVDGPNGKTLCVPSVFVSYRGDALDNKTPLLRSMETLSERALAVLRLLGDREVTRVVPTVGIEQEYFLVDRAFFLLRPDLVAAGRTLLGTRHPKGQELDDHYFGSIKDRVLAFMQEAEAELYKLGIPAKTRHNEVAPNQFETAPIFEEANVASDHNQMLMETMGRVATRHDLVCLLHEKPFAGVNGSGKHCNWSLVDSRGHNLLEPGRTPEGDLRFLVFFSAVLAGVHRRAALLRAAVASAGNDHRLGANEAPPPIFSVFVGEHLTRVLEAIERGEAAGPAALECISLGVRQLPEVRRDHTDRNRTSPFAFTGDKFEFRAVSAPSSTALPLAFLNAAVAEALGEMERGIEKRLEAGEPQPEAVLAVVREAVRASRDVRFEGNSYCAEWMAEAVRRGLPNLATTPEALAELGRPGSRDFLAATRVFSPRETEARHQVRLERYVKVVEIEAETLRGLVSAHVAPAACRQLGLLLSAGSCRAVTEAVGRLEQSLEVLSARGAALQVAQEQAASEPTLEGRALVLAREVVPAMAALREVADRIEETVADDLWTLPKYREMLSLV